MFKEVMAALWRAVKKYAARVGVFVIAVILMTYTLYHCLDLSAVYAETTPAVKSTEYEIAGLTGYIFRDEQVIYSANSGAAVYSVADGERVSVGTELARVYTSGSTAEYLERRAVLEHGIELISRSIAAGRLSASGVAGTKSSLGAVYSDIMASLSAGDFAGASAMSDELMVYLNAYDLIAGKNDSLDDELTELKNQLTALNNSYGGVCDTITNQESGYFYYGSDGYEEVFNYGLIDTLSAAQLDELISAPLRTDSSQAIGRMVYDFEWYLAVRADEGICAKLADTANCEIKFTDSGLTLNMKLDRVENGENGGILIFRSGVMPRDFDYKRVQNIELLVSTLTGYRVPDSAVHEEKGIPGVYVLSASVVTFRKITVLLHGDGYLVVAERDTDTDNYEEYLNLNDEIIISLSDGELYDGRLLN